MSDPIPTIWDLVYPGTPVPLLQLPEDDLAAAGDELRDRLDWVPDPKDLA